MDKRTEELIMKRLAAIIVACLIAIPGVTVGPSSRIVRADAPRYTSVPLDSLPLVDSESSNASILTIQNPGHYRDSTLNSGAQLEANCGGADSSATATATFRLHSKYDELSGIIYDTDTNTSDAAPFTIFDNSDPAHKRVLYNMTVKGLDQTHFRAQVRNVDYLSLFVDSCKSVSTNLPPVPLTF